MRDRLIQAGVNNLKEFGYPNCDSISIIKDPIYSAFFSRMLDENKGVRADVDVAIDDLIAEIKANQEKGHAE